jgi:hypothetical protein
MPKTKIKNSAKVSEIINNNMYMTKDIEEGALEGFKDSYKYYSSDKYLEHLKNSGLSEEQAKSLQEFKINNLLETRINFSNIDPAEYGNNTVIAETGESTTSINPKVSNTKDLARETVWHETGGHSSSKGFSIDKFREFLAEHPEYQNIYSNPWYRRISEHNKELIPELKPVWKSFMNGDMKTFNKLASKEDLEILNKYKDPKSFIQYLQREQEASARAISANIGDFAGKKSQWNLPQLERFFTPEGIKKLRDNVWNIGVGFGGTVSVLADYDPTK